MRANLLSLLKNSHKKFKYFLTVKWEEELLRQGVIMIIKWVHLKRLEQCLEDYKVFNKGELNYCYLNILQIYSDFHTTGYFVAT